MGFALRSAVHGIRRFDERFDEVELYKISARHRAALLHAGAPDGLGCFGATAGSCSLSPVETLKIALAANHSHHDMRWHDYTIDKGCHTTLTYKVQFSSL